MSPGSVSQRALHKHMRRACFAHCHSCSCWCSCWKSCGHCESNSIRCPVTGCVKPRVLACSAGRAKPSTAARAAASRLLRLPMTVRAAAAWPGPYRSSPSRECPMWRACTLQRKTIGQCHTVQAATTSAGNQRQQVCSCAYTAGAVSAADELHMQQQQLVLACWFAGPAHASHAPFSISGNGAGWLGASIYPSLHHSKVIASMSTNKHCQTVT
jgi:hypothetical protein